MTEWVKEDDWKKAVPGIRIKVENHDSHVTGVLTAEGEIGGIGLYRFWSAGWSLFVEATPEPVLPTEPGVYLSGFGVSVWRLSDATGWHEITPGGNVHHRPPKPDLLPMSRLEPVPVTAKRVLDRYREILDVYPRFRDETAILTELATELATEFGVTGD